MIPVENRSKLLKPFLDSCADELKRLPNNKYKLPLSLIILLWDESNTETRKKEYDTPRLEINSLGLNGAELHKKYVGELYKILEDDLHLKNCCGGEVLALSNMLDNLYLSDLMRISMGGEPNKIGDMIYPIFENKIYLNEYKRTAFYHPYNFEMSGESKEISIESAILGNISNPYIPKLLGEATPLSFLHPRGVGNYFIIYPDSAPPNDTPDWLTTKYRDAHDIVEVFQYFKDGIIDIDYYTVYYSPEWVNEIWRKGTYFVGMIRRVSSKPKYNFTTEELPELQKLLEFHKQNYEKFNKLSISTLGQAIQRAARHFSNHHSKDLKEEQFIELIIALESL